MEDQITTGQVGKKYGLIFGLVSSIVLLGLAALRIDTSFYGGLINWAIMITVFVMAFKEYKLNNGNLMTFGNGYGIAMLASSIGGLIRAVLFYAYTIVDPAYVDFLLELGRKRSFGPPPEEAQELPSWAEFFQTPEFFAMANFVSAIFGGLILGAIVSAIVKNDQNRDF